jgi:hypothetical protein
MASCPSRIHHQLVSLFVSNPRHHALPNASAFIRGTVLLPNHDVLPTTDASTECFEENLMREWYSSAKFDSHVSLFLVPIFGVNIYGIKGDFIPELTINTQRPQAKSVQHPFFPPLNRWSLRLDPNPSSSIF